MGEPTPERIRFYSHPQSTALKSFIPLLRPYLPHSNPLYNRLIAPQNHPSLNCLFAASFPPDLPPQDPLTSTSTILFADLTRTIEPQIWLFNPLVTLPAPLSPTHTTLLATHVVSLVHFLKSHANNLSTPTNPISPILRFGCIHSHLATPLLEFATSLNASPHTSHWNLFTINTASVAALVSAPTSQHTIPPDLIVSRVPAQQIDLVISTSTVPRVASTLFTLPNTCLLNSAGALIAWAYLGIDGSLATLYVLPEYRGRGLASLVARELLAGLEKGEFMDLGFTGESGWVHADVKEGNVASEGVMRSLGAERAFVSYFTWVDGEKIAV